jgi:DNA-3-methyladenine glycosylase I
MKNRCPWCGDSKIYVEYHDQEWGVPVHEDQALFEKLILDGAQAGLSWLTILKKRDGYRRGFNGFDAEKIAAYSQSDIKRLLADPGIVRNRLKIESTIKNARGYLDIRDEFGSFDSFIWRYVDYKTLQNSRKSLNELPATSSESDMMSRDLKKRGFNFVGSTICYAYMQAVGMVNDHLVSCFRYNDIRRMSRRG